MYLHYFVQSLQDSTDFRVLKILASEIKFKDHNTNASKQSKRKYRFFQSVKSMIQIGASLPQKASCIMNLTRVFRTVVTLC